MRMLIHRDWVRILAFVIQVLNGVSVQRARVAVTKNLVRLRDVRSFVTVIGISLVYPM